MERHSLSRVKRPITIKIETFPKLIYRLYTIPIKIPPWFPCRI